MEIPAMIWTWNPRDQLYLSLVSVTMTTNGLFEVVSILDYWANNMDKCDMKVEEKQIALMSYHIIMTTEARKVWEVSVT